MTSTYSPSLRLDLQGVGDNTMSWGTVTNNDFTLLDTAISGQTSVTMADANVTLTTGNGIADQARAAILKFTGTNAAIRNVIIPSVTKTYIVSNQTTGGFPIQVKTSAGVAITIPNGTSRLIYCDGTDCFSGDTAGVVAQLNGGPLDSFRNKVINGDFSVLQRTGTVGSGSTGYVTDRWRASTTTGISCAFTRLTSALGSSVGKYYGQFAFTGTGVSSSNVSHRIEGVDTLNGKTVTVSFYIADSVATDGFIQLRQNFGTGGSPSSSVDTTVALSGITSSFSTGSRRIVVNIPSIAGKTLGSNGDDFLELIFILTQANAHTMSLAKVSLTEGDASNEVDPFSPRHIQQELALCQRYYEEFVISAVSYNASATAIQRTTANFKQTKRSSTPSGAASVSGGSLTAPGVQVIDANSAWIGFSATGQGVSGSFLIKIDAEL